MCPKSGGQIVLVEFRSWYFDNSTTWYEKLDFIEFIVANQKITNTDVLVHLLNDILHRELSGFRFINGLLEPIINEKQIKSIEDSLIIRRSFVAEHIMLCRVTIAVYPILCYQNK